jgi:hypothetical protein
VNCKSASKSNKRRIVDEVQGRSNRCHGHTASAPAANAQANTALLGDSGALPSQKRLSSICTQRVLLYYHMMGYRAANPAITQFRGLHNEIPQAPGWSALVTTMLLLSTPAVAQEAEADTEQAEEDDQRPAVERAEHERADFAKHYRSCLIKKRRKINHSVHPSGHCRSIKHETLSLLMACRRMKRPSVSS